MKYLTKLLTMLLFTVAAHAQTTTDLPEVNRGVSYSGFLTTTMFSDHSWFNNTVTGALNIDAVYDDWAIRTQLAVPTEDPIRRLTLEKLFWVKEKQELLIQVGRYPRLDSFYNTVTDSPGTAGLAMLPPGEYNRRAVENRSFTTIDGIRAIYTLKADTGLYKFHYNYGELPIENQCFMQNEATKRPCRDGYKFLGDYGNVDFGVHWEHGNWEALAFNSNIRLKTELLDPKDKTSVAFTTTANKISFELIKLGLKYSEEKWWAQTELLFTDFRTARFNAPFNSIQISQNAYILAGYNWNSQFNTYVEYSYGKSSSNSSSNDRAIGATYVKDDTTVSVEYHTGLGLAWKKYLATDAKWASLVVSVTQRF